MVELRKVELGWRIDAKRKKAKSQSERNELRPEKRSQQNKARQIIPKKIEQKKVECLEG